MTTSRSLLKYLEEDDECLLCGELFVDPRTLPCCGHRYCLTCVDDWCTACTARWPSLAGVTVTMAYCPLCCTDFDLPPGGAPALPKSSVCRKRRHHEENAADSDDDDDGEMRPLRKHRSDCVSDSIMLAAAAAAEPSSAGDAACSEQQSREETVVVVSNSSTMLSTDDLGRQRQLRQLMTADIGHLTATIEHCRRLLKDVIGRRDESSTAIDQTLNQVVNVNKRMLSDAEQQQLQPAPESHPGDKTVVDELTSMRATRMNAFGSVMIEIDVHIAQVDRLKMYIEGRLQANDDKDYNGTTSSLHDLVNGLLNIDFLRDSANRLGPA